MCSLLRHSDAIIVLPRLLPVSRTQKNLKDSISLNKIQMFCWTGAKQKYSHNQKKIFGISRPNLMPGKNNPVVGEKTKNSAQQF